MGFPEDIYRNVKAIISASWPLGIQAESLYATTYEYQMSGRPWGKYGIDNAIGSHVLLRNILRYLHENSWTLATSMGLSEKHQSKDTLLFKKVNSEDKIPNVEWLAIQFSRGRKMYLHPPVQSTEYAGGSPPSFATADIVACVSEVIVKLGYFEKGDWSRSHDAYEFVLKGRPFRSHGQASMNIRTLFLALAECLDALGWETYGSVKQSSGDDESIPCDSWYLTRKIE